MTGTKMQEKSFKGKECVVKIARWITVIMAAVFLISIPLSAQESATPVEDAAETVIDDAAPPTQTTSANISGAVRELLQKIKKGGSTMYALLFLSVTGLTFTLERLFGLRRSSFVPKGLAEQADDLWHRGNMRKIQSICRRDKSALAQIILFVVHHRQCPVADVSAGAGDTASRFVRRHLGRAFPLAVVGTLSPLLGLLGTVFGMMESFEMVAVAGGLGDATLLADGISKALVTTAAGLAIAIPILGLYHMFRNKTNNLAILLEEEASELISLWLMAPAETATEGGEEHDEEEHYED